MMSKLIHIIVPCYRAAANLQNIIDSVLSQTYNMWRLYLTVDGGDLNTFDTAKRLARLDNRISCSFNTRRTYALKNIVYQTNFIRNTTAINDIRDNVVAVVDGDDQLCNDRALALIAEAYSDEKVWIVWTAHRWDVDSRNISNYLDPKIDPYKYPWVTSHLRTFGLWVYDLVDEINFKDSSGEFFKRCYDQALMLPLLYVSWKRGSKNVYIPEVCYQYNINSVSMPPEERTDGLEQTAIANTIRERGFLK